MTAKNWIHDAAEEIHSVVNSVYEPFIRVEEAEEIIAKHCPFKPFWLRSDQGMDTESADRREIEGRLAANNAELRATTPQVDPHLTPAQLVERWQQPVDQSAFGLETSWLIYCEARKECADQLAAALAVAPGVSVSEREMLHAIIADCNALIDPEAHPELNARIDAVLTPCDEAGKCVAPSAPDAALRELVDEAVAASGDCNALFGSIGHYVVAFAKGAAMRAVTSALAVRPPVAAPPIKQIDEGVCLLPRVKVDGLDYINLTAVLLLVRKHEYGAPPVPASPLTREGWQPIETAPTGSGKDGPQDTRHPDYIAPPHLWLTLEDGERCVGYWDWYYAEGGNGYDGGSAWVELFSSERVRPTHWMPLPPAPAVSPAPQEGK